MVLPTQSQSSAESAADTTCPPPSGSTIAQTLQGLISPGSTVYAGGAAVACSSSTVDFDAVSDSSQAFQMSAAQLSIPAPVAILAPVDQRAQQGGDVTVSSRPQQAAVCQLVQPSPHGQDTTPLQGVIGPTGGAVYGTGTQIITTDTAAAVQSQVRSHWRV